MSKKITPKYSPEVRERAVRMVQEHRGEYPSLWAAIESIAPKIGCVPQTLHEWVRKQEIDTGLRDGVTRDERARIETLEREVKELRRANEILNWPARFSPGRSSTADSSPDRLHRPAPRHSRGRADLQGDAGRPIRLLAPCRPAAEPGPAQCACPAR